MKKSHKVMLTFGVFMVMAIIVFIYMRSTKSSQVAPYSYSGHDNMDGCGKDNMSGSGDCGCGGDCGGDCGCKDKTHDNMSGCGCGG